MRKDLKDASETSTTRAAMNVRYVWSAFCAIAIAFLVCTTANDDGDGGFVRARGTQLHVNGTPWYYGEDGSTSLRRQYRYMRLLSRRGA